jgi:hypothetical protein
VPQVADPILVLDITGAHFQAAATVDSVAYAAGDEIHLHFSDREYATRPDDDDPTITYSPRLDGKIAIDRSALYSPDGQAPRVGGMAMPKLGKITLENRDGKLNWMRILSLDGAVATLKEIPFEADSAFAGRLRPVLQDDPAVKVWFEGACAGEPQVKLDRVVELDLVDRFDDRLRKPVQPANTKYLGLGGRIEFSGAGGAGTVAHVAALNVNAFTFIGFFTHTANGTDRAIVCKDLISSTGCPFFIRLRASPFAEQLDARVNTGAGSVLLRTTAPLAAGAYWVALTYNGAAATMRYYLPDGTLVETITTAQTGTLLTNSQALVFGRAPGSTPTENTLIGSLSQLQLYNAALTADQIIKRLRALDMDEPADVLNLVGYWSCVERTGAYLTDRFSTNDAVLSGTYAWGSTLTGEAPMRGQYMPLVLGIVEHVPLTKVDEALEIWQTSAYSANEIFRVYNSELAGLTPTYAVSGGWVLNATTNTLDRTGGANIATWVPGMTVTLGAGWVANLTKVLTVLEIIGPTRVRISGTALATETAAAGLVTANSPQWKLFLAGSNQYIQLLGDYKTPPIAWVQGEVSSPVGYTARLGRVIQWLLTQSAAGLSPLGDIDDDTNDRISGTSSGYANDIMQEYAGLLIPAGGAVTVYDTLDRVLKAVGLHLLTTGGLINIDAVQLPSSKPDLAIVTEEIEDLDVRGLKVPPPAVYRTLYRVPAYKPPQDSISAGAIPVVAELVRAGGVMVETSSTVVGYDIIWPTGAEDKPASEPVGEWTPLRTRAGVELVQEHMQAIAACRPWSLRILQDVGEMLPGTPLIVEASGPERAELVKPEQLYGLEAGVDSVVAGSVYNMLDRRYNVTVLIPIADLEP